MKVRSFFDSASSTNDSSAAIDEDADTVATIVDNLGYKLTETMRERFDDVFRAAKTFIVDDDQEMRQRGIWLAQKLSKELSVQPDMWLVSHLAEADETTLSQCNS